MLIMLVQLCIILMVGLTLIMSIMLPYFYQAQSEWLVLEVVWTILPAIILIYLGLPSLELLYSSEAIFVRPSLVVKIIGHQWYWEYAIPELGVCFDRFTERRDFLRLSDVGDRLVLPLITNIQLLITSHDVIHSFALPRLALKADANPGRLNSIAVHSLLPGVYVGQCSELCGALHSNISIVLEFTSIALFIEYMKSIRD
jgi:cytochrome c oxidase subunit 2